MQQPIPASEFFSDVPFGTPASKTLPTWFLITENDQMGPPAAQHLFAKRMGATVSSIAGSHASMVSHPDDVAAFIVEAAQVVSAQAVAAGSWRTSDCIFYSAAHSLLEEARMSTLLDSAVLEPTTQKFIDALAAGGRAAAP